MIKENNGMQDELSKKNNLQQGIKKTTKGASLSCCHQALKCPHNRFTPEWNQFSFWFTCCHCLLGSFALCKQRLRNPWVKGSELAGEDEHSSLPQAQHSGLLCSWWANSYPESQGVRRAPRTSVWTWGPRSIYLPRGSFCHLVFLLPPVTERDFPWWVAATCHQSPLRWTSVPFKQHWLKTRK